MFLLALEMDALGGMFIPSCQFSHGTEEIVAPEAHLFSSKWLEAEASGVQVRQPSVEQPGAGTFCADILRARATEAMLQRGRQRHRRAGDLRCCRRRLHPVREVTARSFSL